MHKYLPKPSDSESKTLTESYVLTPSQKATDFILNYSKSTEVKKGKDGSIQIHLN